jgi:hypothetical protein
MTVNTSDYLKSQYGLVKAMGDKSVNSDAQFVIDGFEQVRLLTKQFPYPVLTSGGAIETSGPNGMVIAQAQQQKTYFSGQIQFSETIRGDVTNMQQALLALGGTFNATVYEGTQERYHRAVRIVGCFFELDVVDRDQENRSQVTTIGGTIHFHYFGTDDLPGNL